MATLNLIENINPDLRFSMLIFYSFNLTYELPLLGNGYWLVFVIWAVPGLFIGLITRNIKKSLILALVGLVVNFILYMSLINHITSNISLLSNFIESLISPNLYAHIDLNTSIYLFLQITLHSLALPILILFTLFGSLIYPKIHMKR